MDRETSVRLREIVASIPRPDPLLERAARLGGAEGAGRLQNGVVVCAGGAMFRGVVAPASTMATILDENTQWFLTVVQAIFQNNGDDDLSGWDELIQQAERGEFYTEEVRSGERARQEFFEELDRRELEVNDLIDLPDDLLGVGLGAYLPRSSMTLENAQFRGFGDQAWEDVGVVRIRLTEVSAWWPFKLDAPPEVAHLLSKSED